MVVDELLDEQSLDPKKLFDANEFSTVLVNREGFTNKENSVADLMLEIIERSKQMVDTFDAFVKLKALKASSEMIQVIKQSGETENLARLVAICWESGVDFSQHITFFSALVCHPDYAVAIEALTVIEQCEGPFNSNDLQAALKLISHAKTSNTGLVNDLIDIIKQHLN